MSNKKPIGGRIHIKERIMEDQKKVKTYAVTGTFHGSIIDATSEGEARRIFHKAWSGESITHVKVCSAPAALY